MSTRWTQSCGPRTWPAAQPESWKSPASASRELKEQFGTPLFVVSEDDFRARARAFKQAFDDAFSSLCGGVDVYYAGKAFLSVEIARWVAQEGLRLDTCSGGELAVAARAGIPGENLGLHGNNKSDAEIHRALDMGLGRIVVDSLDELDTGRGHRGRPRRAGQRDAAADPRRTRAHARVHCHRA